MGGTGSSVVRTGTVLTGVTRVLKGGLDLDGPDYGDVVSRNSVFSDSNGGASLRNAEAWDVTAWYNKIYGSRGECATISRVTANFNGGGDISDGAVVGHSVADNNVNGFGMQNGSGMVHISDSARHNTDKGFQLVSAGRYWNLYAGHNGRGTSVAA